MIFRLTENYRIADQMLAILKESNIPEVYGFINAAKIAEGGEIQNVLKSWVSAGYPLGNHTFSHLSLNKNSPESFEKEISATSLSLPTRL
jgi:peptidoglycan/xylan/chitin deacetylase (PgdA/CDA1 family)